MITKEEVNTYLEMKKNVDKLESQLREDAAAIAEKLKSALKEYWKGYLSTFEISNEFVNIRLEESDGYYEDCYFPVELLYGTPKELEEYIAWRVVKAQEEEIARLAKCKEDARKEKEKQFEKLKAELGK